MFFEKLFRTDKTITCKELQQRSKELNTPIYALVARKKRKTFGGELTGELEGTQFRVFATPELELKHRQTYKDEFETRICSGLPEEDFVFYDIGDDGWIYKNILKQNI
jgi:hypothetical protein